MRSRASQFLAIAVAQLALAGSARAQAPKAADRYRPSDAERAEIGARSAELAKALETARPKVGEGQGARDALADVEICGKAAASALKYGDFYEPNDVARTLKVLRRGLERARSLAEGRTPWAEATGSTSRGYRSKVDGSVQPYAVIVPTIQRGDPDDRLRLDVVLHGRDARISEVRFFDAHDAKPAPADLPGLVLHVYGRGNNAYRWAGEADVDEAIEAVKRNYRVAPRRIVLRGFSMGGAGAWHLGLHRPSRWSSVEAGAGFTETMTYAKLGNPPGVVRKGLHIYDAVDYAVNAFDVPIVGYGGENDPQAQGSKNILDALIALGVPMKVDGLITRAEGVDFTRIIGKGIGHQVDKPSAQWMKAFHDDHIARGGSDPLPRRIRFATYTLKYNQVGWLEIMRLGEHYRRATLDAEIDGELAIVKTDNVLILAVDRQAGEKVRIDGQEFPLREAAGGLLPDVYFRKLEAGWELLDHDASRAIEENARREKHPGVQGPIDDAFTASFLCVRGTGTPHNPKIQAWADARLSRFAEEWGKWMRGDLRIKDDTDVTPEDIDNNHLILFGDPGSNRLIARALPELPFSWTSKEIHLGGASSAADHAPVLVAASPLNRLRYVGINAVHTFGSKEFNGTNALLYPRLGDYAVFRVGEPDEVKASGFFDERWK